MEKDASPRPLSLCCLRCQRRLRRLHGGNRRCLRCLHVVLAQWPVPQGERISVFQPGWLRPSPPPDFWIIKMMLRSFFGTIHSLLESTMRYNECVLFVFVLHSQNGGIFFYQSVFGSASASTSIGASAVLWLGSCAFETAAEEPLSGGVVCFGRSVVEFGGYRLSANMYMIIWMYVCRYVGMSVYKHVQYDLEFRCSKAPWYICWIFWGWGLVGVYLSESCLNKSATKMDSSKTILKLKGKLVERKRSINQKSKLKFFGAPTASRASVASVASIASTSTVATSSSSFTASSFNRRNRRRLGKFLGFLKNKETYPSPHNGWWFLLAFRSLRLQSACAVCFCSPFPEWGDFFLPKRLWFSFGFCFHRCIGSSLTWKLRLRNSGGGTPFWWWCVVMCVLEGRL